MMQTLNSANPNIQSQLLDSSEQNGALYQLYALKHLNNPAK